MLCGEWGLPLKVWGRGFIIMQKGKSIAKNGGNHQIKNNLNAQLEKNLVFHKQFEGEKKRVFLNHRKELDSFLLIWYLSNLRHLYFQ